MISPWLQILAPGAWAALGGLIGFLSAGRVSTLNDRRAAIARLRTAFAPAMAKVRLGPVRTPEGGGHYTHDPAFDINGILTAAFPDHAAAIEAYRPYVPRGHQASFQKAWQDYYSVGGSVRFFYFTRTEDGKALYFKKMDAILKFAKP